MIERDLRHEYERQVALSWQVTCPLRSAARFARSLRERRRRR
jgi:hypothetical protein